MAESLLGSPFPNPMHSVNQQLLADRLGLSRATISRCFTNHRAISPHTRARVFDLAAELGYHYLEMRTAAGTRKKTKTTIGVLICHEVDPPKDDRFEDPRQKLLDGISQQAQLSGAPLDVHYVEPAELTLEGASYQKIGGLGRDRWDGALLVHAFPENVIDALLGRFPCVSLLEQYARAHVNCVDVDHHRGISRLMDLLAAHGHRRLGFFSIHPALGTYWAMHRFSAYFEKMLGLGLVYRPADVINVLGAEALSEEDALRSMQTQTNNGVTAWVCANDHAAYAAMADLSAHGVRVPEDVSVTGFDGIQPPNGSSAVATEETPFCEIGRTGAERLLRLIKRPFDPSQHILVGTQMRPGETVGPVAIRLQRQPVAESSPLPA